MGRRLAIQNADNQTIKYNLKMMLKKNTLAVALVISFLFTGCGDQEVAKTPRLGSIDLEVTASAKASTVIEKGILLLHSFEYYEAKEAFLEAQKIDPKCPLAFWGEAMAYHQPLFHRHLEDLGRKALRKFGSDRKTRLSKINKGLERDLFVIAEVLFSTDSKKQRLEEYHQYIANLYEKYPENNEVASWYALALLTSNNKSKKEQLELSARISKSVIHKNPNHPGALHYLIHANDYPAAAKSALDFADAYAKVAPDAAHALHMPSHIYVALGMWKEVIASNIASWNASFRGYQKVKEKPMSYHSLNWLQYGLYQVGHDSLATELFLSMQDYMKDRQSPMSKTYYVDMLGAYLFETGNWESNLLNPNFKTDDLHILKQVSFGFILGNRMYHDKRLDRLYKLLPYLKNIVYTAELSVDKSSTKMCSSSANPLAPPTNLDINLCKIMLLQLDGYVALLENDELRYEEALLNATNLDDPLVYNFGPPQIYKPINETYAEYLLDKKKYQEALKYYNKALTRHPNRLKSLEGKLACLKILEGDTQTEEVSSILQEMKKYNLNSKILL